MKKYINSSWYKVTPDELKNKQYLKRNISELIKEAGYKERIKTKLTFLPRLSTSASNKDQKNETPKKYINYLHTNYKKRPKSNKQKSANKSNNSSSKNKEVEHNKEKIFKIYKMNINKNEYKKQEEICFFCLSYLEDPILLECSHKICKKCLDEMALYDTFIKTNNEPEIKGKKSTSEIFGLNNW